MAKLTSLFKTSSLAQIQDITIDSATLANNQILQYDSTTSKWKNVNLSSTSGTSTSIPVATTSTLGGIQIGFNTNDASRNYAVSLNGNNAYVNVPWTDTKYSAASNSGLTLDVTTFSLDTTKVPVLSTAVATSSGSTSGYVYWEAATSTTSGSWKLNALTGGSTYTAGDGINITSSIAVKLNTPATTNPSTGIYTTNSGLTLETAGLRINQTVTPVLSTTVSNISGYVYWEAATSTTSGSWRLSNPQGGVKVIKDKNNITINLESKIILDLSDDAAFPASTATPALSLSLPDYTYFNAGHTIEFFDAASKFDVKNVEISAATDQKINTGDDPILLDITYSTIKFIYSGDPAIGWVF